jgi:hypothetical protein
MYRKVALIVASAAVAAFGLLGSAPAAMADGGGGISWTGPVDLCHTQNLATPECIDRKNGGEPSFGQTIWMYNKPAANGDLLQIGTPVRSAVCDGKSGCGSAWPFKNGSGLNARYNGFPVDVFGWKNRSGEWFCLGVNTNSSSFPAIVKDCPGGSDGNGTYWVETGHADDPDCPPGTGFCLVNVYGSDAAGHPKCLVGGVQDQDIPALQNCTVVGGKEWNWVTP